MVTVNLVGRMGNQLFQIAASLAYAARHSLELHIPSRTVNETIWPMAIPHLKCGPISLAGYHTYNEPSHRYTEIPKFENVILNGYFQSAKYFDDQRQLVLDTFAFPWMPLKDMVGIHVRRGDYVTDFHDKHPFVGYDYLSIAIKAMVDKGYKSFVVCSDDISWCRKNLDVLRLTGAEFSYSVGKSPQEDLSLLSCCRHTICSNSSFSWWAHYLNRHEDKVPIMPKIWFGINNQHLDATDIYFENAILI